MHFERHALKRIIACAMALAIVSPAHAQDPEVAKLKSELRELQQRTQALEKRLEELTAARSTASAPPPAAIAPVVTAATATPSSVTPGAATQQRPGAQASGLAAFNPAISAILAGSYNNLSRDPALYRLAGFATAPDIGPVRRGFSLGESELTFSANADHKFAGVLTFSMSADHSVEVEEAYGILNGAPYGVVPKFGRFLSAAGYLNEQHAHAWDFVDAPLAYHAFLGGQYKTDGVQLRWVAPTEHYVELGAELGNGDAFPGSARSKNGAGATVLFARIGGDIGESHNWLAGLSYLGTRAASRPDLALDSAGEEAPAGFTGRSRTLGAQFVWKYAPNGNPTRTNLKVQGEYFWRKENGDLVPALTSPLEAATAFSSRQGGGYMQGVYQFMPMWRAGLRYDRLDPGDRSSFNPERATAMVDWSPSEFSRVRLQVARAKLAPDFTDNEVFVQYILSLGAHGAHRY